MPSPTGRFLGAATQPFADNAELQVHARRELEERIDPATADDPSWELAADTMERHAGSRIWKYWRQVLFWAVLVTALAILPVHFLGTMRSQFLYGRFMTNKWYLFHENFLEGSAEQDRHRISHDLSTEQQWILFGDPSKATLPEQLEGLWKRFPDNPVYYAAYARSYRRAHLELPRDFLTTAAAIDPGNGWFPYFAAAKINPSLEQSSTRSIKPRTKASTPKWKIYNRPNFDAAVALLHQSAACARFDSYFQTRTDQMSALLPDPHDFGEVLRQSDLLSQRESTENPWYALPNIIAAQAEITADTGDTGGFRNLCADWTALLEHLVLAPGSYYLQETWIKGAMPNLQDAASRLGLEEEKERLVETQRRLEAAIARKRNIHPAGDLWRQTGMTTQWVPYIEAQYEGLPVCQPSDLTASRLSEHAWTDRIYSIQAAACWMLLAGVCSLYRFRHRPPIRVPGYHLATSFQATDWCWLLGGGILIPLLYVAVIHYLSPFGGRNWNISRSYVIPPLHAFSGIVLAAAASLLIARWRFQKRLPEFTSSASGQRVGWMLLVVAAVTMPLADLTIPEGEPTAWMKLGLGGLGLSSVWTLVTALRAIVGKPPAAIARQSVACVLTSVYLFGALVTLLVIPLQHAEERYWTARDTFVPRASNLQHESPNMDELLRAYDKGQTKEALEILAPMKEIR